MGAETANSLGQLPIIPYLIILAIFWFFLIKPQRDKEKKRKDMVQNLVKNDNVVTVGGIHGRVVQIKETTIVVRVDDNAKIEFDKESIQIVNSKPSEKQGS
jgi:preprotein translocase subunit YajC